MGEWTRKRLLLAVLAVVFLVSVPVVVLRWWGGDDCRSDLGEPETVDDIALDRRTADDLSEPPEPLHGPDVEAYDSHAGALTGELGGSTLDELEAFYPGGYGDRASWEVPYPVGLWGDTLVVDTSLDFLPGVPWETTLTAIDLESGATRPSWVRSYEERIPDGGRVGDRFLAAAVPEGGAPEVVSITPADGEVSWCRRIGADDGPPSSPALEEGTQTTDGDLLVARLLTDDRGTAPGAMTTRLAADSGDTMWEVTDDVPDGVRSQHALGDLAIQSVRAGEGPQLGGLAELEPIVARDMADGSVAWTYTPDDWDGTSTSQYVIGAGQERVVIAQARVGHDDDAPDRAERRLVALDADGEVQWEIDVGGDRLLRAGERFTLAEGLLIGWWGTDDFRLTAWNLDDGSVAWEAGSGGWESGSQPLRLERAELVDGRLLVPSFGLTEIDLRDGTTTSTFGEGVRPSRVLVGEERVVVRTGFGLAVFTRS